VPTTVADKLIDFASVADGWHVLNLSVGPVGDITLLLADRPRRWQFVPSDEPVEPPAWREPVSGHRLLHFAEGHDHGHVQSLELPGDEPICHATRFADGRWLTIAWLVGSGAHSNARVWSLQRETLATFWIGVTGHVQITRDDRIWTGWGDESIYGGGELEWGGIGCLSDTGEPLFRFNVDAAKSDGPPGVWCSAGINVVSDDEVWCSYYAEDAPEPDARPDEGYALVQLDRFKVGRLWPWRLVMEKAPASPPGTFAVHGDRLLLQGVQDRGGRRQPTSHRPDDWLYVVPLTAGVATQLLPVGSRGNWIGPFRSEGRCTKLYLATKSALYIVDAASISGSSIGR
jgi:hypothetical protein